MFRVMRMSALGGLGLLIAATVVSHESQIAQLPLFLLAGRARYLATLRLVAGIPIEFFGLLWFLFVAIASTARTAATYVSLNRLLFWSGLVVCGVAVGLFYQANLQPVPVIIAGVLAGVVSVVAALQPQTSSSRGPIAGVWMDVVSDGRQLISHPGVLSRWMAVGAVAALSAQYMSLTAAATGSVERDAQFIRWYESRPRILTHDLAAPNTVRVVMFTDYECPFCAILLPELHKVAARYRDGTELPVEIVARDFPLNADCNAALPVQVHPAACEAAAAVRLVRRVRGDKEAHAFGQDLYQRRGKITKDDVAKELAKRNLVEEFRQSGAAEMDGVRRDAAAGAQVGITGTPTVFVDGRLVRNISPRTLEAILDHHVRQRKEDKALSRNDPTR